MGNSTSCAPLVSKGVIKVLHFDGRLRVFKKAIKAAELMVAYPGHFVCPSNDLIVGHRILGLLPDEELERRQYYFVLPMDLLYSVLTQEEMSSFTCKASKPLKHEKSFNNHGKIVPVLSDFCTFPSEVKTSGKISISYANNTSQPIEKYTSKNRSWCPALETIVEAPS